MYKNGKRFSGEITIAENLRKQYNLIITETLRKSSFEKKGEENYEREKSVLKKEQRLDETSF